MTHSTDSQALARRLEIAGMPRHTAEELVDALGPILRNGLARRRDVDLVSPSLDRRLREMELQSQLDLKDFELRLTLRVGWMLAAATALLVVLLAALLSTHP